MNQYPVRKIWNEYDRGIICTVYNLVIFSQKSQKFGQNFWKWQIKMFVLNVTSNKKYGCKNTDIQITEIYQFHNKI